MQMNRPRLIALRTTQGHTQESLAEKAGISERSLNLIESGATVLPRVSTLRRLAEALDTTIEDLVILDESEKVAS